MMVVVIAAAGAVPAGAVALAAVHFPAEFLGIERPQPEPRQQSEILRDGAVRRRQQFVSEENRVRAGGEAQRLRLVAHLRASGGNAHDRLRHQDARDRDDADEFENVHRGTPFKRRSRARDQRVDRHGLRLLLHVRQLDEHFQTVVHGFAHAENPAGADAHARRLHVADRFQAVVVSARRNDFRVILPRRVEIVIVNVAAGLFEAPRLLFRDQPERAAYLQTERLHAAHRRQHAFELRAVVHAPPRRAHAEARRSRRLRLFCGFDDGFRIHQRFGLHARFAARRLGAIRAVFRARAGFYRLQHVDLHGVGHLRLLVNFLRVVNQRRKRQIVDFADILKIINHDGQQ